MDIKQIAEKLRFVSETPLLDARLLYQYADGNPEKINQFVARRVNHEPVSKIIGKRGFWKGDFIVNADVLDPRPDSEMMIEAVLQQIPDKSLPMRFLDIGVGSGCLLYSLLDEYPGAVGVGIDKSEKALTVAHQNKGKRSADLLQRDFFNPNWTNELGLFDVVISNPPYIPTSDIETLSDDVRLYDPILALDGGTDGLNAYRILAKDAWGLLKSQGKLFLEIGIGQKQSVTELFLENGWDYVSAKDDFGGIPRIVVFQKK